MTLSNQLKSDIEFVLRNNLKHTIQNYESKLGSIPYHSRMLGKDGIALYSLIKSLDINYKKIIFESIAVAIASSNFTFAQSQQIAGYRISSESLIVIDNIINSLSSAKSNPNKIAEISAIRAVCQKGEMKTVKPTIVDIKLINKNGTIYLFDLKTPKPNFEKFKEYKRTLLEWVATTLASNPTANVQTIIAIPYNPYEPQPYFRWRMVGMLDLENELKVANEFWDFLGGDGAYLDLLSIFESIGIELRPEIDNYFTRFNR